MMVINSTFFNQTNNHFSSQLNSMNIKQKEHDIRRWTPCPVCGQAQRSGWIKLLMWSQQCIKTFLQNYLSFPMIRRVPIVEQELIALLENTSAIRFMIGSSCSSLRFCVFCLFLKINKVTWWPLSFLCLTF